MHRSYICGAERDRSRDLGREFWSLTLLVQFTHCSSDWRRRNTHPHHTRWSRNPGAVRYSCAFSDAQSPGCSARRVILHCITLHCIALHYQAPRTRSQTRTSSPRRRRGRAAGSTGGAQYSPRAAAARPLRTPRPRAVCRRTARSAAAPPPPPRRRSCRPRRCRAASSRGAATRGRRRLVTFERQGVREAIILTGMGLMSEFFGSTRIGAMLMARLAVASGVPRLAHIPSHSP